MTNGNDPISAAWIDYGMDDRGYTHDGLTKREYFAANCPDVIPAWFVHTPPERILSPKIYTEIKWANIDDEKTVSSWHRDPCFDLNEHLKWYQDEWDKYYKDYSNWEKKNDEERFFQWRTFYADGLINALNK